MVFDSARYPDLAGAAALCACAIALLLFLLERPRSAAGVAAIALGYALFPAHVRATLVAGASGVAASTTRDAALLQLGFGAVCLLFAFAARRVPRELGVALFVGLATAFAAHALAMLVDIALASGAQAMPPRDAVLVAIGMLALALGLFAYGVRRDAGPIARPRLWPPLLLALAIVVADLLSPQADALRCGYAAVVACGALAPERAVTRLYARVSIGLALFGFAASWRGAATLVLDIVLLGLAIGAILLTAHVIDRLQRAEGARRRLERERDALLALTHSGCIELDLSTMSVTAGTGSAVVSGLAASAPLAWADFVANKIAPAQQAAFAASVSAARAGEAPAPLVFQPQRLDGASGEAALCWVPRHDDRGMLCGLTGVIHDRTRYKRSDRDRAELRARLRNAHKLESLALLSGGVAHDLNNTLVPVSILAPLLFDSVTDPADRRTVELIVDAAQRARELARDMLAYARDDRPAFAPIALAELVRDSLPLLRARIPTHITICDAVVPVPQMTGNQRQIYQMILNLMVNAAEAIGARAGSITIGTTCTRDAQSGRVSAGIFVADDGEGMDPGLIERAFEPFFSTKDGDHATGIGLSIVRRIVKLHGGSIAIDSTPGRGTRFDLFFPAGFASEPAPSSGDAQAGDLCRSDSISLTMMKRSANRC